MPEDSLGDSFRERHLARLLITLYFCGTPVTSLLEGSTRQIDSPARLQHFDFWMREPGHLALALLQLDGATTTINVTDALSRMTDDAQLDKRRVPTSGAPYRLYADLDEPLSFLVGTGLVIDRPSFNKNQSHEIVLESSGIALVEKIFAECPSFLWYKAQGELIAALYPQLEQIDLGAMPYLAPELTPSLAAIAQLTPYVLMRAAKLGLSLGEIRHVDV
jgi:hypothetical protein